MPMYEYQCRHGHRSEIHTPMDDRPEEIPCQVCGQTAHKVMAFTQRPIVKGGTPSFHGHKGAA